MFRFHKEIALEKLNENTSRKILAYGGKMMGVEVYFNQPTTEVALHEHPHEQLTYVLKGKFEFFIKDESRVVEEGDSLYFEPNIPHGCKVLTEGAVLLDIFTPQREEFLK